MDFARFVPREFGITKAQLNSTQLLFTMTQNSAGGKQRKTNWSSKSAAPECKNLRHDIKTH